MAQRSPSFRTRTVGVHQQAVALRRIWPDLMCQIRDGRLTCRGPVRPTDISETYLIGLSYRAKHRPRVWVEEPRLRRRPSEPEVGIPHAFNQSKVGQEKPCLFYKTDWRSDMLLADTVIPWLYEWLMYYEIWHQTGTWYGGGVDHGGQKET